MTDLPKGWALGSLEEITHRITKGTTPTTNGFRFVDKGVSFIKIENIGAGRINRTSISSYISTQADEAQKRSRLLADDLLFSIAGTIGATAIVKPEDLPANTNQALAIMTCVVEAVYPPFLQHALQSHIAADTIDKARGGAMNNISLGNLKETAIPIPPLNEQRRIVDKIEAMFEKIEAGEAALRGARATLGLYRQSLLKSAFEGRLTATWRAQNADKLEPPKTLLARIQKEREARYKQALDDWQTALAEWRAGGEVGRKPAKPKRPGEVDPQHIPEGAKPDLPLVWGCTRLGSLNISISDGPFGSNLKTSDYTDAGVQVIRLENIGYGEFISAKQTFVSQEKYQTIAGHTIYPGTIVVSSFVTDAVRSCVIPSSVPIAINKADCFAVVLEGENRSHSFLAYFLQSGQVFKQLEGLIHGVGRPRINTTQLKELHFPICSPAEQAEITRILDARLSAADAMEAEIDAALARATALRQSILKQAFSGTLVPQDPSDEPATALLARIKAERTKTAKAKTPRKAKA